MSSMARALPAERVAELRQAIHSRVTEMGIKEEIQQCLEDSRHKSLDEESILQLLESKGMVEKVMQSLKPKTDDRRRTSERRERGKRWKDGGVGVGRRVEEEKMDSVGEKKRVRQQVCEEEEEFEGGLDQRTGEEVPKNGLSPNRRHLFLRVTGGRAFLDHLQHSQSPCSATLTVHLCFRGQRVHSRPVPCACEPDFSEGFLLELVGPAGGGGDGGRMISFPDALAISEPIRLVITRRNERGETDLVGTHDIEWRSVLTEEKGKFSGTAEMNGVGHEAKISSGLVDFRLEIFPKSPPIEGVFLSAHRETERQQNIESERLFLVYSKQWWREYLQVRHGHAQRMVKIFSLDESGRNRCVCGYVWPLRAGRLLDGPRHAARFVSLVALERSGRGVGGGRVGGGGGGGEIWSSLHTLLCLGKGDVEDHSCLLCSLLLGYGLEAYICLGTKTNGHAHSWVVTIGNEGGVTFWESLTGQRYKHVPFNPNAQAGAPPTCPTYPYRTIGCLFNHASFLANTQPSDSVVTCVFDLENRSLWKRMSRDALLSGVRCLRRGWLSWSLHPPLLDPVIAANELEQELRTLFTQHRTDLGLTTIWDDTLSYLLTPALASYELERCGERGGGGGGGGRRMGEEEEEFQDAIRGHVEEGHTFKGFPIQLCHCSPRRAFLACFRSPVGSEIVSCRGDQVKLALRVKMYCYPENMVAVWIMVAATYCCVILPPS